MTDNKKILGFDVIDILFKGIKLISETHEFSNFSPLTSKLKIAEIIRKVEENGIKKEEFIGVLIEIYKPGIICFSFFTPQPKYKIYAKIMVYFVYLYSYKLKKLDGKFIENPFGFLAVFHSYKIQNWRKVKKEIENEIFQFIKKEIAS